MTKERFVERYGVPRYTVGVGGSGGAIQQYVYGQNHPGLLDAGIPVQSYPDMTTQTIHVGDCELLEHYMDVTDAANPKWRNWDDREWLIGLNASATVPNPYTGRPGSTECVRGWRGLTPLALNPLFGTAGAGTERMDPAVMAQREVDALGGCPQRLRRRPGRLGAQPVGQRRRPVRPPGAARRPHHAAGVPRPQRARRHVEGAAGHGPGGPPFLPGSGFDPWSARNMRLSADATPAPRRTGDVDAMRNAYRKGLYFDGDIDIPIIDVRPYLEEQLDMHNSHQSFAVRQRMLDADRDASNQAIWFWGPEGGEPADDPAGARGDRRVDGNLSAAWRGVAGNRPARSTRASPAPAQTIAAGRDVWAGILDRRAPGPVHDRVPAALDVAHRRRRPAARRRLQVRAAAGLASAIVRGLYGGWRPSAAERARLEQIFPTGVCDYSRPDVGRPHWW